MESNPNPTSRKRKHGGKNPNPNPLSGVFTRSKSQRLHHCSRSGRVRLDPPVRKTRKFTPPPPSVPAPPQPVSVNGSKMHIGGERKVKGFDEVPVSYISIKDLRARRVFSRPVKGGVGLDQIVKSPSLMEKCVGLNGEGNPNLMEKCDLGIERNPSLMVKCDSRIGLMCDGNPSLVGKCDSGFDLEGEGNHYLMEKCDSRVEINPNLLGKRDLGVDGNPNLTEKCDLGVERNPNLLGKCDLGVERNPNLVDKCDLGVDLEGEGNPNLLGKCDLGVERNPNLVGKCDLGVDLEGKVNPNLSDKCDLGVGLKQMGSTDRGEIPEGEKAESFDVGLAAKRPVPSDMSPRMSSEDLKGGKNGGHIVGENVQTTPPDAVISVRDQVKRSSPPKRISPSKVGCTEGKKSLLNTKRNSGLKPCSRSRVFKAMNSFSYRRLLPFLMDLEKDTSRPVKLDPGQKTENNVEGKPLVSTEQESLSDGPKSDEKIVTSLLRATIPDVNTDGNVEEKDCSVPEAADPSDPPTTLQIPSDCSLDTSQVNLVSNGNQVVTPISDDPANGGSPQREPVSSDTVEKLGNVSPNVESGLAPLSIIPKESPDSSIKDAILEASCRLSLYAHGDCRTENIEFETENAISLYHNSSKLEASVSPSVPISGLAKGILKRNPRGCRGICNCLNCATFRLNAEKAFEFSRNQLLDAEELALGLIKEVSNLRCMLEKSVNEADSNAIIPVNQVQEACRRASNVEVAAKHHLSQMNEDLHVHCRNKPLQRPTVNFSGCVEEKLISKQFDENASPTKMGL